MFCSKCGTNWNKEINSNCEECLIFDKEMEEFNNQSICPNCDTNHCYGECL